MTQQKLKVLSLISAGLLSLTLFSIPTLICLVFACYFTYRYFRILAQKHISRGLIEICPEKIKTFLLHRSMFDFICSLWFDTSFIFLKKFFKLLFKPLVEPIERQNAHEALNDMDEDTKEMYLTKGVIRVMPQFCQNAFLGKDKAILQRFRYEKQQEMKMIVVKGGSSDNNTDDKSYNLEPKRLIRVKSEAMIRQNYRMQEDQWSGRDSERELVPIQFKKREVVLKKSKRVKSQGLIQTIHHSLDMLKRILQMQNISGHIQNISTASIVKVMIFFWVALLIQIKFNKSCRKTVIRMLYAMGGMITVLGVAGTTGVLLFKHLKRRRDSDVFQIDA